MMIAKRFLYLDALVKEVSCRETCVRRRCCFLWVSFYEGSDKAIRESKENHERHLEREKNDDEAILIWSWRVKKLCKWTNNTDLKVPLSSAWIQISQTGKAKNCGAKSLLKSFCPWNKVKLLVKPTDLLHFRSLVTSRLESSLGLSDQKYAFLTNGPCLPLHLIFAKKHSKR